MARTISETNDIFHRKSQIFPPSSIGSRRN